MVAAQNTSVFIMQSFPSLREIQPVTRAVSMDKCHLSSVPLPVNAIYPLLHCQSSSSSLVRASDWDPGSNPGWIQCLFFFRRNAYYVLCVRNLCNFDIFKYFAILSLRMSGTYLSPSLNFYKHTCSNNCHPYLLRIGRSQLCQCQRSWYIISAS